MLSFVYNCSLLVSRYVSIVAYSLLPVAYCVLIDGVCWFHVRRCVLTISGCPLLFCRVGVVCVRFNVCDVVGDR